MTALVRLSPHDRLLVFAPHPDDETLAAGELIQSALAVGAAVRVVFATDGENNPWPQRWIERRWHIGPEDRARWAVRRRGEGATALALLGAAGSESVRFLGWPDQGVTDLLMDTTDGVATLAGEISAFMPSHVVMPMLADRHPDHGALRVMIELALLRTGSDCVRLGYAIHGQEPPLRSMRVDHDPERRRRKREALAAHASQTALSGGRLSRVAERTETFEIANHPLMATEDDAPVSIRIPYRRDYLRRPRDVLLVLATAVETRRYRCPLPALLGSGRVTPIIGPRGEELTVVRQGDALIIDLPMRAASLTALYAKLHRTAPRIVIFDRQPWSNMRELLRAPSTVHDRRAAPGFI